MKTAFYDFKTSPYSYDFLTFWMTARARGCEHVVFVPGERAYQKLDKTQQRRRFHNLIIPLVESYTVCKTREEAKALWGKLSEDECFPDGYTVDNVIENIHAVKHLTAYPMLKPIEATQDAKDYVREKLNGRRPVVITIRQTMRPARNSTIDEWVKFANYADSLGHSVIFIPDTDALDQEFGHESWPEAAEDIQIRIALMEAALVNMGVPNGPMSIAQYSAIPFLQFKNIVEECVETSSGYWRAQGIYPGSQHTWFNKGQRFIWEDDSFESLKYGFDKWMDVQKGESWGPRVLPELPMSSASTTEIRHRNMAISTKAFDGRLKMVDVEKYPQPKEEAISIVCYGPSLKDTWQDIKRPIMTVSGAHDFLIERGIVPDYHVDSDPRAHKAAFTANPHPDVHYLMASCCDPKVWEQLKGFRVSLWHSYNTKETIAWAEENDPDGLVIIGGSTAGMRAIEIAAVLGFVKFEVFGMDSCYGNDGEHDVTHAGAHNGKPQKKMLVTVFGGKQFLTSPQLIQASREFLDYVSNRPIRSIKIHGYGMLHEMYYQACKHLLEEKNGVLPDVIQSQLPTT